MDIETPEAGCRRGTLRNAAGRRGGRPAGGGDERLSAGGCRKAGHAMAAARAPEEAELHCAVVERLATCGQHERCAHAGDPLLRAETVRQERPEERSFGE